MPRTLTHRNIKTKDRRHLAWYTALEDELESVICAPGTGITLRKNKGSSCFVGSDGKPIFELACEGPDSDDRTFGVEKGRVDAMPATAAMPWRGTFNVVPVNANDATFYEVPLPGDAASRRRRVEKLLEAFGIEDDGQDELGAAIDNL